MSGMGSGISLNWRAVDGPLLGLLLVFHDFPLSHQLAVLEALPDQPCGRRVPYVKAIISAA